MNRLVLGNILRFVVLVLIQVLIFNKINLGGYLNPYVYVMFILLLPFETPKWLLLVSSFAIGLSVDLFSGTIGMHAAASTFMAFVRPAASRIISSRREYESGVLPGINNLGIGWFISWTLLLVFIHHLVYFYLEVFRFSELGTTFIRVVLSTLLTSFMILILDLLFKGEKR
jgi:rod shape-determining protein MreD